MGPIQTKLKYKKARHSIDYAISALAYAQKCLRQVKEDDVTKTLHSVVNKLTEMTNRLDQKNKTHQTILATIKSLEYIYLEHSNNNLSVDELQKIIVLANKISSSIQK